MTPLHRIGVWIQSYVIASMPFWFAAIRRHYSSLFQNRHMVLPAFKGWTERVTLTPQ